jgi:hypothetical protein
MSNTTQLNNLEHVRRFIASHGHDVWIEGEAVHFVVHHSRRMADGSFTWGHSVEVVKTKAQARDALGY